MSTINELLAEFNDPPLTQATYRDRRAQLILQFRDQHGLSKWSEIAEAVRDCTIDESDLVDEFIELRAFEPLMSKRQRRRDEPNQSNTGRDERPFSFGAAQGNSATRL